MNDNIEKQENNLAKEQKNTDNKSEEINNLSIFVDFIVGITLMIYTIVSGRLDLLEAFSDIDNYMGQYITILLVMTKAAGAGCCGIGSRLFINNYTGGTQENRTIEGVIWFLAGITMLGLKSILSAGGTPCIQ